MQITLLRDLSPTRTCTEPRGTENTSEKNSTSAAFARPSRGGAQSAIFSASPTIPVMAVLAARG
jgi:hypothetical protein